MPKAGFFFLINASATLASSYPCWCARIMIGVCSGVPPLIRQGFAVRRARLMDISSAWIFFLMVAGLVELILPSFLRACSPSVIIFLPALFIVKAAVRETSFIFFCLGFLEMAAIRKSAVGGSV